jgi:hypothetical protein
MMCSECGDVQPLTIVAKDEQAAQRLVDSLNEKGAGLRDRSGSEVIAWPTADGTTVTIPFNGNPGFALAVVQLAVSEDHVTEEEAQFMLDRGYADSKGITFEEAVAEREEYERTNVHPNEPELPAGAEEFLRSIGALA